jgi:hypothetical protein
MREFIDREKLLAAVKAGEHTNDTILQIEEAEAVTLAEHKKIYAATAVQADLRRRIDDE